MNQSDKVKLKLGFNIVTGYVVLAFLWWFVLLYTKNQDAFLAKVESTRIYMIADGTIKRDTPFSTTEAYQTLKKKYRRQEYMILGEGAFFIISIFLIVFYVNRSYNKQIESAIQQRNFLLSITHELKSPIASIRLALETLNRRQIPYEKSKLLTTGALNETDRLTTLVEDLLLSAKLESSYQPNFEKIDLLAILEEITNRLQLKNPNATIIQKFPDELPAVKGDYVGLQSVFINLTENAFKYSTEEPYLEVEVLSQKEEVLVNIKDRGLGISDIEKKKVFNRFYRVGNEDTRKTKGTGLGLYIVKSIIEAHNGTIRLTDHLNEHQKPHGSIFTVSLPLV